jgi:hypothetical protein
MAHFAKLGANGKVIQVLTMGNKDMKNADGVEDESVGQQYLERHNNWPSQMWIQTSYNTKGGKYYNADGTEHSDQSKAFRGNYAGIGYEWDEDNQIFWPKKPYASWVKNTTEARWQSPKGDAPALTAEQQTQNDAGTHKHRYEWNESSTDWELKSNL